MPNKDIFSIAMINQVVRTNCADKCTVKTYANWLDRTTKKSTFVET